MMLLSLSTSRPARALACGLAAAALVVSTTTASSAQTPSLADIAKKEQERRKGVPTPQKVYTNKDVPAPTAADAPGTLPPPQAPPTPVAEQPPAAPQQKPAGAEKDEAWWRARITAAREELRRNEVFLEALQSRINALSADFVNRDDPYQRAKIGEDRQKSLAEIDRVKREIENGKKFIGEIEEEARKSGVPPGWLR